MLRKDIKLSNLYLVKMTIHETGEAFVEADSVSDALSGLRTGRLTWDEFVQTENPRVGFRKAKLWKESAPSRT